MTPPKGWLGHVDRAHPSLADRLKKLVRANNRFTVVRTGPTGAAQSAGSLGTVGGVARLRITRFPHATSTERTGSAPGAVPRKQADTLVVSQQCLGLPLQFHVAPACLVQVSRGDLGPLGRTSTSVKTVLSLGESIDVSETEPF